MYYAIDVTFNIGQMNISVPVPSQRSVVCKLASNEVKEKEEEITPRTTYPFSARGAMPIIPRLRNMRQMVLDMINNSIDEEEDEAIERAIIASLQD